MSRLSVGGRPRFQMFQWFLVVLEVVVSFASAQGGKKRVESSDR